LDPRLAISVGYLDIDSERRELRTALHRDLDLLGVHRNVPDDHFENLLAKHREQVDLTT
jgi:hypothetical protein